MPKPYFEKQPQRCTFTPCLTVRSTILFLEVDQARLRVQRTLPYGTFVSKNYVAKVSINVLARPSESLRHMFFIQQRFLHCVVSLHVISLEIGSNSFIRNLSASILLVLDAVLSQDSAKTDLLFFYSLFCPLCISSISFR